MPFPAPQTAPCILHGGDGTPRVLIPHRTQPDAEHLIV